MRKQKIPPFEELIERLYNSVVLRHPNRPSGQKLLDKLTLAWKGKDELLYKQVKQLEINKHKANVINKKTEVRQVEFMTGFDVLGFPTFTQHIVKFENITRDPKRYKKKGSDFSQIQTKAIQVEFKEGLSLKKILNFQV